MRRAFFFIVAIAFATTSFASIPRVAILDDAPAIDTPSAESRVWASDVLAPFERPAEGELTRALRQGYGQAGTTNASGLGRFLSPDPGKDWDLNQPQSWNMYSYVRNNPMNAIDPDGRNLALAVRIGRVVGPPVARYALRMALRAAAPTVVQASGDYLRQRTSGYAHPVVMPPALMESATKPGAANGETAGKRFPKTVQEQAADEARDEDGQTHCQVCGVATSEPGEKPVEGEIKSNTDHIMPASQGGDATINNAQHTCETCNKSGGANPKPKKTGADKLRESDQ